MSRVIVAAARLGLQGILRGLLAWPAEMRSVYAREGEPLRGPAVIGGSAAALEVLHALSRKGQFSRSVAMKYVITVALPPLRDVHGRSYTYAQPGTTSAYYVDTARFDPLPSYGMLLAGVPFGFSGSFTI